MSTTDEQSHVVAGDVDAARPAPATAPRQRAVTVDREVMPLQQAQRLSKKMFIAGCFLLPWFWITNVWLFWPYFRGHRQDPVIEKYTKWSGLGFSIIAPLVLVWMISFTFGYTSMFSRTFLDKYDASQLDLAKYGWLF